MNGVYNVNVTIALGGTLVAGTTDIYAFSVPTDALGGGITITQFGVLTHAAIGAGSAPAITLLSCSAAGVVNGTIGTKGSAATTAGTLASGTITSAWVDGTYLVKVRHTQVAASADACYANVAVQYKMGR